MDEWSMFSLIAKKLEEIANKPENKEKAKVKDDKRYARVFHDLSIAYKEFTNTDEESMSEAEPKLGTDKQAVEAALANYEQYEPWTIEDVQNGGFYSSMKKQLKPQPVCRQTV